MDNARYPFNGTECPSGYQRMGTGLRPEEAGTKFYQAYTCVKIDGSTELANVPKGTLMGIILLPADSKGNITSMTPVSNAKLDNARYPFNGAECPTNFQRLWLWLRPEDNGTKFYQVYTCVKTEGSTDLSLTPKGWLRGWMLLIAKSNWDMQSSNPSAVSNYTLDKVRFPFNAIECPTGYQRVGTGLRPEDNGTSFYQVYSCVKYTSN